MVIENLKDIAPERKCYRLVGGVLVERTVKDVLPALRSNRDQVMLHTYLFIHPIFVSDSCQLVLIHEHFTWYLKLK